MPTMSLRTLFVLVGLLAALAAWYGTRWRQKEGDRRLVHALRNAGAVVERSDGRISAVWFVGEQEFNERMAQLVNGLSQMPRIKIGQQRLTTAALQALDVERLRGLELVNVKCDAGVFREMARAKQLTELSIWHSHVSGRDIKDISSAYNIVRLSLGCNSIDTDDARHIARLPKLNTLDLRGTSIDATILPALQTLSSLREIDVRGTKLSVDEVRTALPHVEIVRAGESW